jgi:hypothetical protein
MGFFIPAAKSAEEAENVWQAIHSFARSNLGSEPTTRRIFRIRYHHDGNKYEAEVGRPEPRTGETVIAILESVTYLVCTANRGVVRGIPILVGRDSVVDQIDFKTPRVEGSSATP